MGHVPMGMIEDRSLALRVNDPACWTSTPVLQSTPDEDLSLMGTETYGDTTPLRTPS